MKNDCTFFQSEKTDTINNKIIHVPPRMKSIKKALCIRNRYFKTKNLYCSIFRVNTISGLELKRGVETGTRRLSPGEAGTLQTRDLQHHVLLLEQEPGRAPQLQRTCPGLRDAARQGDRLHRPQHVSGARLLQRAQPKRGESVVIL
jgi:hypothetical protein